MVVILGLSEVRVFSDALEVVQAINGVEDWWINAICEDVDCVSDHIESVLFHSFLETFMGSPLVAKLSLDTG